MRRSHFSIRSREYQAVTPEERVLVALVPSVDDWDLAREQNWYRIPVRSAPKPMEFGWIAFYQSKKNFGREAWAINYWARVQSIETVQRRDWFPRTPHAHRSTRAPTKNISKSRGTKCCRCHAQSSASASGFWFFFR